LPQFWQVLDFDDIYNFLRMAIMARVPGWAYV